MTKLLLLLLAAGQISTTLSQSLGSISPTVIVDPPPTCGPTTITNIHTTTYTHRHQTITSKLTELDLAPHSCYTATKTNTLNYCPQFNPDNCGPHPDCIVGERSTVPCKDVCCPTTATVTTAYYVRGVRRGVELSWRR